MAALSSSSLLADLCASSCKAKAGSTASTSSKPGTAHSRFRASSNVCDPSLRVIIQRIFHLGQRGLGGKIFRWSNSAIFVFVAACFVYSLVYSILGRTSKWPYVANVADMHNT